MIEKAGGKSRKKLVSIRICAAVLALSATLSIAQSRKPARDPRPKGERERMDEQVFGRLAKAWASFYDGKVEDAVKLADPLLKLSDRRYRWVAVEAAHIQARSYWAHGSRAGQTKARRIWKRLEKLSTLNSLQTRLKIAQALELEAAEDPAKLNQGIAILEQIIKDRQMHTATPEAGIDLARLYVQAKRFDDAEKTLKFVIKLLGDKRSLARMELPDEKLVRPYIRAAKAALKRLRYRGDAGREEFEAAEKLRKQAKWMPAYRAYQAIIKDFPDTDYVPRSELAMGHCLVGLRRVEQAAAHWKKFIEARPAGPWRAQALIALIDIYLEEQLNLPQAGKYAALARSSLPSALADEKSAESWKAAAFDIHLRVGLVTFCEGKGEIAAEAFEAAKKLTDKKTTAESLDALIAAAKTGKAVIPADCRASGSGRHGVAAMSGVASAKREGEAGPAGKAALALSMGVIHLVASRLDNADAFFDRVLGTRAVPAKRGSPAQPARPPMSGATPAQRAFATFGRGAVLQARREPADAKEQFLASIKAFATGSWHDETLYRIATITQDQANAKFGKAPEPTGQSTRPLTAKEREAAAKDEKERLTGLSKSKKEALGYYQGLMKRYPKSPLAERAWYMAGRLQLDLDNWSEGLLVLDRFAETYPNGPCTGEALLIVGQCSLERRVDANSARDYLTRLDAWIAQARKKHRVFSAPSPIAAPRRSEDRAGEEGQIVRLSGRTVTSRPEYNAEELVRCHLTEWYLDSTELQCAKLLGFICFAGGQKDKALAHYARITKLDGDAKRTEVPGDWSDYSRLKWGLEHGYLYAYPDELDRYDARQRLAVLLADFYYVTQRFDDAAAVAQRLLKSSFGPLKGPASQYPQYLYATCVYWTRGRAEAFEEYLKVLGTGRGPIDPKTMSTTRERAAYAAGKISLEMPDGPQRRQGKELLRRMAFSGKTSRYAYQARITYAAALINEGKHEEGIRLLETFPESAGDWRAIALSYVKAYREAEQNSKGQ